jgi:tRNA C32,U32 (ribose-2'-O)-methylase TrmJ
MTRASGSNSLSKINYYTASPQPQIDSRQIKISKEKKTELLTMIKNLKSKPRTIRIQRDTKNEANLRQILQRSKRTNTEV